LRRLVLGDVATVTKAGYATVKIADPGVRLKLGLRVVDDSGREVGRLVDVIGRVEEPYAVVRVSSPDPGLAGRRLFIVLPRGGRGGRRGRGARDVRGGRRGRGGPRGRGRVQKKSVRPEKRHHHMQGHRRGNRRERDRRR